MIIYGVLFVTLRHGQTGLLLASPLYCQPPLPAILSVII